MEVDGVPEKFYKYRPMSDAKAVERAEEIVMGDEIYFAGPATFNDPFDLKPAYSLAASPEKQRANFLRLSRKFRPLSTEDEHAAEADKVMRSGLSPESIVATTREIQWMLGKILSNVGVFCVSTKGDDILMWSHYADAHTGICLEFDGFGPLMAHAHKVFYSASRTPVNPYEDDGLAVDKAMLTKSLHWAYEEEWRLIDHERGPGKIQYRPENLTGIVLGAHASSETVAIARKWQREHATPLALYRARFSSTDYLLEIHSA